MKNLVSRGIATLTATSLSLAAVPAFAMGGPGGNNGMHFGFGLHARGDRGGVTAEGRLEAMTEKCDQMEEGERKEHCEEMLAKLSARMEAGENSERPERERPTVENIDNHVEHILSRAFHHIAKMARRVCSGDETVTVSECMEGIKDRLQNKVSGLIDAAFEAEIEAEASAS